MFFNGHPGRFFWINLSQGQYVIGAIKKAPRRSATQYVTIIMHECRLGSKEKSEMDPETDEMSETEVLVSNFYTISSSNGRQMKKWMDVRASSLPAQFTSLLHNIYVEFCLMDHLSAAFSLWFTRR